MSTDREALRLQDIIENIDRIETYVTGLELGSFEADIRTVDAVERCLQRITEAVIKIGPERMADISPRTPSMRSAASATCSGMTTTGSISAQSGERSA